MSVKKCFKILGMIGSFIFVTIVAVLLTLVLVINSFCNGQSTKARELFVTTFLETGQMKFIVSWFLKPEEIQKVVESNSLKAMNAEINTELINIEENNKKGIEVFEISGSGFYAKMLVIHDPSTISLATTYPWSEYGIELDKLVTKAGAIAGVNGGLYESSGNKGGRPIGVAVSNGEIQHLRVWKNAGLHLIGLDNNNILRIIDISVMSNNEVRKLIEEEGIRDAVCFQDETTDKNNHFVKLIINGEKRELNGLGSGANPRTAIGQREDGSILLLVTDGRGANGHLGATASDLIDIMSEYGAVNAANIDGGSSSSMYYNNEYLMTSVTLYYSNSSWRLPTAFVVKEK
ncbi:MAG: phosphodiester glycosidase family protein [Bacilli bacterium]|nr:phosphodiester glycosidase family protein [Bacilli bacterium]